MVFISGESLPMLLRQHEDGYSVFGPGFLPEIVKGEI